MSRTRLAWFKCFPAEWLDAMLLMDAAARGIYCTLAFHYWQSGEKGIPNDDKVLQRIANCTLEEWTAHKTTVLAGFEVRENTIYHTDLREQREEAVAKVELNRKAAAASWNSEKRKSRNANVRADEDADASAEVDTDAKPIRIDNSDADAVASESSSSADHEMRVSPRNARQTSGRIAAPTSDTSSPLSSTLAQSKPAQEDRPDDIERIRALFVPYGKVPHASAVAAMLHEYPVEEIEAAFEEYVETLEPRDHSFVEYQLCHDGGLKTVIFARRQRLKKSEQEDREWKEREQQRTAAKAVEGEAWKTELKLVLPTWQSEEVFLQWKKVHPMPQILRGTAAENEVQEALRVKYQEWQKPVAADREQK